MNKLKEINGKYYQECEVLMLATDKAENALLLLDLRGGKNLEYHKDQYFIQEYLKNIGLKSLHLYLKTL